MGQEIRTTRFSEADFARYGGRLQAETALLARLVRDNRLSSAGPCTGFELEAWLVDDGMEPVPANAEFLAAFNDELASPELARFNVEFNNRPRPLTGGVLAELHGDLLDIWTRAGRTAEALGVNLVAIGILPTVREALLDLRYISDLNRYRALNEQILAARRRQPLRLDIRGHEQLASLHADVMLEAAATSFQIHWQVPQDRIDAYFNAAILASAPVVAVSANSPFLFGKDLWAETRIPLFEQAVDTGSGSLRRVSFGTDYARRSIVEVFEENLADLPVLLPMVSDTPPERFAHLRLHNGTIWRWNRPLVGFDPDGTPHLRIEHRVIPAGPSLVDMIANAAFFYGLTEALVAERWERDVPFAAARDNFYRAARDGLAGEAAGRGGIIRRIEAWVREDLLPLAERGLRRLRLDGTDIGPYLGIIEQRVASGQTGSEWQRRFIARHPGEFAAMTREYLNFQRGGEPVHRWPL
jgi:gamma-glutamyl:cysteine ligase YbdK (ATP-grasp superfamily)